MPRMLKICPGWKACVVAAPVLGLLLGLGTWQMQRAEFKRTIVADYEARSTALAVALPIGIDDYAELRYAPVTAQGAYDGEHQFLLDNQVRSGRVGYHVMTPLKLAGVEAAVLVDRGWVAQGLTRQLVPDVSVDSRVRRILGSVYVPFGDGFRIGVMDADSVSWPRVVVYVDFGLMAERLGYALLPVIIRLDPSDDNGYARGWTPLPMGPERHLGYAVQWYALAAAFTILMLVAANRSRREEKN